MFLHALVPRTDADIVALDVDPNAINTVRENFGPRVLAQVIDETAPQLPNSDSSVDAVTLLDVLEHMPPVARTAAFAEFRRVLRPNGTLVVTVPHAGWLSWADMENIKFRFPRLHRYLFTRMNGRDLYERRYGGVKFGNFTAGQEWHEHFSEPRLRALLAAEGFQVIRVRRFGLAQPFLGVLLRLVETWPRLNHGRRRLVRLVWWFYLRDADIDGRRLAASIAVSAQPRA
jgi:SAM-dependent methyltransferase